MNACAKEKEIEMAGAHIPERMCVACRVRTAPQDRLRLVMGSDKVLACDLREKLGGRGAWICARAECFAKLFKRKHLGQHFKGVVWPEMTEFIGTVVEFMNRSTLNNLGLAYRGGLVVSGRDEVKRAATSGKLKAILLASDLADDSQEKVRRFMPSDDVLLTTHSKENMGNALGRVPTGVVGLRQGRITKRIVIDLKRLCALSGINS